MNEKTDELIQGELERRSLRKRSDEIDARAAAIMAELKPGFYTHPDHVGLVVEIFQRGPNGAKGFLLHATNAG